MSELTLGYLDDVTLGGPIDVVAADVQTIVAVGEAMGMHLNCVKCELLATSDAVVMDPTLLSFNRVDAKDAVLLGAPLFTGPSLDEAWSGRCAELRSDLSQRLLDCSSLVPRMPSFCFEHRSVHPG